MVRAIPIQSQDEFLSFSKTLNRGTPSRGSFVAQLGVENVRTQWSGNSRPNNRPNYRINSTEPSHCPTIQKISCPRPLVARTKRITRLAFFGGDTTTRLPCAEAHHFRAVDVRINRASRDILSETSANAAKKPNKAPFAAVTAAGLTVSGCPTSTGSSARKKRIFV